MHRHLRAEKVLTSEATWQRFCQRCMRFHGLESFEGGSYTCVNVVSAARRLAPPTRAATARTADMPVAAPWQALAAQAAPRSTDDGTCSCSWLGELAAAANESLATATGGAPPGLSAWPPSIPVSPTSTDTDDPSTDGASVSMLMTGSMDRATTTRLVTAVTALFNPSGSRPGAAGSRAAKLPDRYSEGNAACGGAPYAAEGWLSLAQTLKLPVAAPVAAVHMERLSEYDIPAAYQTFWPGSAEPAAAARLLASMSAHVKVLGDATPADLPPSGLFPLLDDPLGWAGAPQAASAALRPGCLLLTIDTVHSAEAAEQLPGDAAAQMAAAMLAGPQGAFFAAQEFRVACGGQTVTSIGGQIVGVQASPQAERMPQLLPPVLLCGQVARLRSAVPLSAVASSLNARFHGRTVSGASARPLAARLPTLKPRVTHTQACAF